MYKNPGIALTRTLGLSLSLLGLLLALALPAAPSALAAGDVNEGSCPNEANTGFTAELPDCRAYEQVTPMFKNGFELGYEQMLDNGELLRDHSIGLIAGATNNANCAETYYDTARTPFGWETNAIDDAPLREFAYATHKCITPLLGGEGTSLLQLHPIHGSVYERNFYLHTSSGFRLVGRAIPESAVPSGPTGGGEQGGYQGSNFNSATPTFSHLLFTLSSVPSSDLGPGVSSQLWPGDSTLPGNEGTSLYEYSEGSAQPLLVGVSNAGQLISDCSTVPGGAAGSVGNRHNVMSSDGSRIFFTAIGAGDPVRNECVGAPALPAVDELFARLAASSTVSISEPDALAPGQNEPDDGCKSTECIEDITEVSRFRDANFEGAALDGSKVFFSSTQQLLDGATQDAQPTDSATRGGCGSTTPAAHGCNLYEYDLNEAVGHRLVLLSAGDESARGPEVQGVAAVSEDGSHVYFVAKGVLTSEPNSLNVRPSPGGDNLYVRDTVSNKTTFVTTLSAGDSEQWHSEGADNMNVTDDGQSLLFTSTEHLTVGDTSSVRNLFRYNVATGALARISVGDEGHGNLGGVLVAQGGADTETEAASDSHPAMTEDGNTVVFSTSEALTPAAEDFDNRCVFESEGACREYAQNVYEYREGRLFLISHGAAIKGLATISANGQNIFFDTAEKLVPQDRDTLGDIYDARSDGGFAYSPGPATTCGGEGCQTNAPAAPGFLAPSSAALGGNSYASQVPATPSVPKKAPAHKRRPKCRKGFTKARGKCIKVRRKSHAAKARAHRRKSS